MGVTKELCMLPPKISKARAVKDTMSLITHSTSGAKRASAQVPISQACPAQLAERAAHPEMEE